MILRCLCDTAKTVTRVFLELSARRQQLTKVVTFTQLPSANTKIDDRMGCGGSTPGRALALKHALNAPVKEVSHRESERTPVGSARAAGGSERAAGGAAIEKEMLRAKEIDGAALSL